MTRSPTRTFRRRSALALAALVPLAAPLLAQGEAGARALPPDAAVLVRIESTRAWNDFVHAFAPLNGSAALHDLQGVLDGMASYEAQESPETLPRLDPGLPLYLAVSFAAGGLPGVTFAAPVTNAQPFRFHETFGAGASRVQDGYSIATTLPEVVVGSSPPAGLAELRPGLAAVHVDLAGLIGTYRPLIDTGLRQFEMSLDQFEDEDAPFDIQPLMEAYLDLARGLLDRAEALDVALEREGDSVALALDYTEREAREVLGEGADLAPLLGYIAPNAAVQLAYGGRWPDYLRLFDGLLEGMLAMYPEPLRADMEALFTLQDRLDPLLLPGAVMAFDLGQGGMHGSYVMRSKEPGALIDELERLMRELDHEGGMVSVGARESLNVDGHEARVLTLQLHFEALAEAMAQGNGPDEPSAGAEEEFLQAVTSLYGRETRVAMLALDDRVHVGFARDDDGLRSELARVRAPATPSPKLQRLLRRFEPGAAGLAYHLDFGELMGGIGEAMQALLPGQTLPDLNFSMDLWLAPHGRVWSSGVELRLDELIAYVKALESLGR